MNLSRVKNFHFNKNFFLQAFLAFIFFLSSPSIGQAQLQLGNSDNNVKFSRSLESLRDLDYQTWQVVVYLEDDLKSDAVLRVVGYPGTLRLDHPTSLQVHSGRRDWFLEDITLSNPKLAKDPRDAAAEFAIEPLLDDLSNNRPLRLILPGVFEELPVPPYLVGEWRSIIKKNIFK